MTTEQNLRTALSILSAIIETSDRAQALGGATTIPGIAALHTLQESLQRNRPRIVKIARELAPKP